MMRRWERPRFSPATFAVACALALNLSCSPLTPQVSPRPDEIVLYEGLSHQFYESDKFGDEKKKPIVEKGGFPFYREPLPLKDEDVEALGAILADPVTFRPFTGEKKCGGFHPDYAIAASSKGEETTYLMCFGCGEAQVLRPDGTQTCYNLGRDAAGPKLGSMLKPYRKNRPASVEGP